MDIENGSITILKLKFQDGIVIHGLGEKNHQLILTGDGMVDWQERLSTASWDILNRKIGAMLIVLELTPPLISSGMITTAHQSVTSFVRKLLTNMDIIETWVLDLAFRKWGTYMKASIEAFISVPQIFDF